MRHRTVARTLGLGAMVLVLSGCMKLEMNLELRSDDTVNGDVVFAVSRELLSLAGGSFEDFKTETDSPVPEGVEVTTEPYEDDDFVGERYTFEGAALSEFAGGGADELSITRLGDTFVVVGSLDMSDTGTEGFEGAEQLLESFDMSVSVTFPGEVESATGEIDGNTVTWELKPGQNVQIEAVGSAIGDGSGGGGGATLYILIAALVAVAIVVGAVLMRRARSAPVVGTPGDFGGLAGEAPAPAPMSDPLAGVASAAPTFPPADAAAEPSPSDPAAAPVTDAPAPAEPAGAPPPGPVATPPIPSAPSGPLIPAVPSVESLPSTPVMGEPSAPEQDSDDRHEDDDPAG